MDTNDEATRPAAEGFPAAVLVAAGGCVAVAVASGVGIAVMIEYELIPFVEFPACFLIAMVFAVVGLLRRSARGVGIAEGALAGIAALLVLAGGFVTVGLFIEPGDPLLAGGVGLAVAATVFLLVRLRAQVGRCRPLMVRR